MGIKREKEKKLGYILKNGTLIVANNFFSKCPAKSGRKNTLIGAPQFP